MATYNFTRLFLYLSLALAVAASSNPNAFGLHRRDHADLGRVVKKRMPILPVGNQLAARGQEIPSATSSAAQSTQDTSAAPQTTPANSASVQSTSAVVSAPASATPSTTGGLLSSVVGGLLPTESSATSSILSTAPSSTSDYLSSAPQTLAHASNTPATTPSQSILYLASSTTPIPTQTSAAAPSSGISHAAVTVLIVIAASVGAAVIVWTIIRKWKFRPSSDFEGRMQPIDWQPGANEGDAGLPGQRRPLSRASSFHSGSGNGHVDDQMRGPIGGYGATPLNPIPDHDFTAGPAHLAPVGGYADLARGPNPQPMMHESFGMAPSINRPGQYDQHGVPLYHGYSGY